MRKVLFATLGAFLVCACQPKAAAPMQEQKKEEGQDNGGCCGAKASKPAAPASSESNQTVIAPTPEVKSEK